MEKQAQKVADILEVPEQKKVEDPPALPAEKSSGKKKPTLADTGLFGPQKTPKIAS